MKKKKKKKKKRKKTKREKRSIQTHAQNVSPYKHEIENNRIKNIYNKKKEEVLKTVQTST